MCACSFIYSGRKIALDMLTFPSVRTENNAEPMIEYHGCGVQSAV